MSLRSYRGSAGSGSIRRPEEIVRRRSPSPANLSPSLFSASRSPKWLAPKRRNQAYVAIWALTLSVDALRPDKTTTGNPFAIEASRGVAQARPFGSQQPLKVA